MAVGLVVVPSAANAWGNEGHKIVADIAATYLTPTAASRVYALLAADHDALTAPDLASRATWADAWRAAGHRETSEWHYVDLEVDHPDVRTACFGEPASNRPASAGPARDCIVDRIDAFERELADPSTSQPERILALKFLIHFVGDLHQPLHASDNHDRGGNCVRVALLGARTVNLHSYWDTRIIEALGPNPKTVAAKLRARISPAEAASWRRGGPSSWAMETYAVSRANAYWPGAPAGCDRDAPPVTLPDGYARRAKTVAAVQLERAGVRLAYLLNQALDHRRS